MNNGIEKIIIEEGHFTEADYPFTIKPTFSAFGSIIEISTKKPLHIFLTNVSKRDHLRFNAVSLYEEYNLLPNPVDILSLDSIFLQCNIAQGKSFQGKRSGIFQDFTMDHNPCYENIGYKDNGICLQLKTSSQI